MKLTPSQVSKLAKGSLIAGGLSLTAWVALVLVPGAQGEFFFFYFGITIILDILVFHYGALRFEDPRQKGRPDVKI